MIYKKNYTTLDSGDCFSACLFSYLSYLNITFNYDALFILGHGLHFVNDQENYMTMVSYKSISDIYFNALDQLQIKYHCGTVKSEPVKFLFKAINEEIPIILRVSTAYLEYNKAFKENIPVGHFVNAIGIDPDNERILISDGYVPTRKISKFQDWVPMEEILNACAVFNNEYYIIEKGQVEISNESINKQLHLRLKETIEQDFLSAPIRFAQNIAHSFSIGDIEQATYISVLQLKIYGFFPGLEYLKKCLHKCNSKKFEEQMELIITDWNLVVFMIIKLRFENTKQYYNRICDKVKSNTEQLQRLINEIVESKLFLNSMN
jgi:hypothetical protein